MGTGAAATTYYDVVTRYYTQNRSTGELRGYDNAVLRADRSNIRLHRSTGMVTRGFRGLSMALAPMVGGSVLGVAAFGLAGAKAFGNLNTEMNSTIQLAGQLNLAFKYDNDPAKNFVASMTRARGMFRDLVREAARLPGETSDFLGIGRMISGPVFHAGGSTDQYTKLISKLALATPATGGRFDETGRGAMMMLQGRARGVNPLTAYMMSNQLLSGHNVTSFNALDAAARFKVLNDGLSQLTDNPMFRKSILNTFDTQLGTLADTLFGVTGIGGRLAGGAFQDVLTSLTDFNVGLDKSVPTIVGYMRSMGDAIGSLLGVFDTAPGWLKGAAGFAVGSWETVWGERGTSGLLRKAKFNREFDPIYKSKYYEAGKGFDAGRWLLSPDQRLTNDTDRASAWANHEFNRKMLTDPAFIRDPDQWRRDRGIPWVAEAEGVDGELRSLAEGAKVTQNFHIKVAISTDESPEAVAVKIRKAADIMASHPTMVGRGVAALPASSGRRGA